MGNSAMPSADKISLSEFSDLLARYPSCIEVVSESKGAKPGQKTLVELDEYRHVAALDAFGSEKANTPMGIDDVTTLVEWKLRHGKFRPTLMKLVASNEADTVADTVQKAVDQYRDSSDVSAALGVLTTLRGIGPATASLLLAVHDGQNVIFFADEAFYWLCCGGSKAPIKYNLKEYMALNERAQALARRLGVKAVDVERVAFVLMREPHTAVAGATPTANNEAKQDKETKAGLANDIKKKTQKQPQQQPAKRKPVDDEGDGEIKPHLRRSKRGKQA